MKTKDERLIIEAVVDGETRAVLGTASRDPKTGEVELHFDPRSAFGGLVRGGTKLVLHPDGE